MNTISKSLPLRRTTAGLLALGAVAFAGTGMDAATAATGTATCASSDLVYERTDGSAQFSARVAGLRSTNLSCPVARDVAGFVTKRALFGTKIRTYRNFTITDETNCNACGPDTKMKATRSSGGRRHTVTWTIEGGR